MSSILSAFTYSRQLTFNTTSTGANVASNLTNFPICIVVNASSWSNSTERGHFFSDSYNPLGKRVQFFDADGTTNLAYEVESYNASTQVAIYWVKVPQVDGNSSTDHIHVAYGNDPNGSNQDSAADVWSNGYVSVFHLGGNSWAGSSPQALDSLGNHNFANGGSTENTTYGIGSGRSFVTNQYVDHKSTESILRTAAASTIEMLATWNGTSNGELHPYTESSWFRTRFYAASGHFSWGFHRYNGTWRSTGDVTQLNANTPYHLSATFDNTVGSKAFINGVQDGTPNTNTGDVSPLDDYPSIGRYSEWSDSIVGGYFGGSIDEVRLSTVARTSDWLKASAYSIKKTSWNGDGWLTIGAETSPVARPTITDSPITNITPTGATGNGNVTSDGGAAITGRGICWSLSPTPTTSNNTSNTSGTTGTFSIATTGTLSPGTLYYWRMYAMNSVGKSYSTGGSFTTGALHRNCPIMFGAGI